VVIDKDSDSCAEDGDYRFYLLPIFRVWMKSPRDLHVHTGFSLDAWGCGTRQLISTMTPMRLAAKQASGMRHSQATAGTN